MKLSLAEFPVDRVMGRYDYVPNLPLEEIQALHDSGLSTDEDGEAITDVPDSEIPYGWHVIEADDFSFFMPLE